MGEPARRSAVRDGIARGYTVVEDVVYVGLGLLLAALVLGLLAHSAYDTVKSAVEGALARQVVRLLDRILLILLIVEVLYTVKVSFREHALAAEPFLLIGIISVIRRVLLLTAEFGELTESGGEITELFIWELAVLAALLIALAGALVLLKRSGVRAISDDATRAK